MIVILRLLAVIALVYEGWIIFRVVDDWLGIVAAIISVILLPITAIIMPIIMLFIPSSVAGQLSLWPAVMFIGLLSWVADKLNSSLYIH